MVNDGKSVISWGSSNSYVIQYALLYYQMVTTVFPFKSSAFDRKREAWTSGGRFSQCGSWPRASLLVEVRPPEWCVNYSVNYNKLY